MAKNKPVSGNVDPLEVAQLRGPLLDQVMQSPAMRAELMDVAREIKSRYIAKVPKDTGRLAQTVRIKAFHSNSRDRRWNVDLTIGGILGVDYADDIEAQYGTLASVLREMGYNTGDYVVGPRGKGAKQAPAKVARAFERQAADERMAQLKANPDPEVQKYLTQLEKFSKPGRDLNTSQIKAEYLTLRNSVFRVQAKYGNDASRPGYDAMRNYRGARMMIGLPGHPTERRGGQPYLDQDMMDERKGEMGGVTWEMRKAGIPSPYDLGKTDPLTNYFSEEELRYYGRDPRQEQ